MSREGERAKDRQNRCSEKKAKERMKKKGLLFICAQIRERSHSLLLHNANGKEKRQQNIA